MIVKLISVVVLAMLWLVVISEVIIPSVKNRHLFPIFNKRRRRIESEIKAVKDDKDIRDLKKVISDLKRR